jgi:hypothetical protein
LIHEFVKEYFKPGNIYDWGDDPAFFMATKEFSNANFATWGVCRPEVRSQLKQGDLVIFFCGRQEISREWNYYFIGFGTVQKTLRERENIWLSDTYKKYRSFYNLLIRNGQQFEPFGKLHTDWEKRSLSPYVFFETKEPFTSFNISSPLKVATCIPKESLLERWDSDNSRVKELENILFKKYTQSTRRLRINNPQRAHVHIRYKLTISDINNLRNDLLQFVK